MSADDVTQRGVWTNHASDLTGVMDDLGHTSPKGRVVGILPERYESCDRYGCKPVVVLDPDDSGDMEDLMSDYWEGRREDQTRVSAIRRALRLRLEPPTPPKPDEPTGLGAVVADLSQGGRLYVRHKITTTVRHWSPADGQGDRLTWDEIQQPEVRGPGLTPDEPEAVEALPPDLIDAKAEAWDEAAEAINDWMWNNPGPSGIHSDPPRNPYDAAVT